MSKKIKCVVYTNDYRKNEMWYFGTYESVERAWEVVGELTRDETTAAGLCLPEEAAALGIRNLPPEFAFVGKKIKKRLEAENGEND